MTKLDIFLPKLFDPIGPVVISVDPMTSFKMTEEIPLWRHIECLYSMMTSSNGNIFRVTGPLSGEFTGHRWIPLTKASDAELSCFFLFTSSNGNIFRVTGPLCGEFTGHRWIPLTKASDAELSCFFLSAPWINGLVNNPEASDLRRAHYDVIIMYWILF